MLELVVSFDVHLAHLFGIISGHLHHFSHLLLAGLLVLGDFFWSQISQHLLILITLASKLALIVFMSSLFLWRLLFSHLMDLVECLFLLHLLCLELFKQLGILLDHSC